MCNLWEGSISTTSDWQSQQAANHPLGGRHSDESSLGHSTRWQLPCATRACSCSTQTSKHTSMQKHKQQREQTKTMNKNKKTKHKPQTCTSPSNPCCRQTHRLSYASRICQEKTTCCPWDIASCFAHCIEHFMPLHVLPS